MENCTLVDHVSTEDMALTERDKDWIRAEFKPSGWKRANTNILAIGSPAAIIGVFVTLLVVAATQYVAANKRLIDEAKFEEKTDGRLSGIEKDLVSMRVLLDSNQPGRVQYQRAAQELIAQATQKKTPPIPETVVEQAGNNFIDVAAGNEGAWKTALDFVTYRSSLNRPDGPILDLPQWTNQILEMNTRYQFTNVTVGGVKKPIPEMRYLSGFVRPQSEAARVELLSSPQVQQSKVGVGTFVVERGALALDGTFFRHAVLVGVEVYYAGGPVVLEDVVFVDCKFIISNTPEGRTIGSKILASSNITLAIRS